jgi:uncharacterized protein (DUF342 family)
VEVAGGVCDLFRVHSGGRLRVGGVIEAADVRAGAGLHAAGGISGKGKGRVAVEGDVYARYLANAAVAATGDVVAALMVTNSRVACGGRLVVAEGPVRAGHVTANGGVACAVAGAPAGPGRSSRPAWTRPCARRAWRSCPRPPRCGPRPPRSARRWGR